ncbi:MAG: flavin reductase [Bacteroidia bacterium]|nr:flavin reductase [Bacteroidia bacterium]
MPDQRIISREEISGFAREFRRTFVNSLSGFKSLHLCGTIDFQHRTNLSVMNSVIHIGADPPLLGMVFRPDVVERHTLTNLEQTGFFTLSQVTEPMCRQAHQTSARYPQEVSEFDATGLTPWYSGRLPAPYVAESPVKIGLQLQERHHIMVNATLLVVGRVLEVILPDAVIGPDGFVDLEQAGVLAASGLDAYFRTQRVARYGYAKPGQLPELLP